MTDESPNHSVLRAAIGRATPAGLRLAGDVLGLALLVVAAFAWSIGFAVAGFAVLVLAARGDR